MNSFRTLFGFNTQLIYYLRQNPLNEVVSSEEGLSSIYLGNIYAAYSQEILKKHNITAVLTVAAGTQLKYTPEQNITHLVINAEDIEHYNLSRHFEKIVDFIDKCRKEQKNILVHCFAGISRSTTSVCAYLMREKGYGFRKCINMIRPKRKEINPNPGFMRQMAAYEKKLKMARGEEITPNQKQQGGKKLGTLGGIQYPPLTGNSSNNNIGQAYQTTNNNSRSKSWNTNKYGNVRSTQYLNNNNNGGRVSVQQQQNQYQNGRNIFMNGKKMAISVKQQQQNNNNNENQKENNNNNGQNLMGQQFMPINQKIQQQQQQQQSLVTKNTKNRIILNANNGSNNNSNNNSQQQQYKPNRINMSPNKLNKGEQQQQFQIGNSRNSNYTQQQQQIYQNQQYRTAYEAKK